MTFFESVLRKITLDCEYINDPKFVGGACVCRLTDDTSVKLSFSECGYADHYSALLIELMNIHNGRIDEQLIKFADIWGKQKLNNDFISPYAWTYRGETEWYCSPPNDKQYKLLSGMIDEYLSCFADPVQEIVQDECISLN